MLKNKKILIVTEYFYPEEFKINEIAIAWMDKGYEVDILTQNPTYPYGEVFDDYQNRWYVEDNYEGMKVYRVKAVTGYKSSLFKKLLKYFTFMFLGSFVALKIGKKYDYVFGFDVGALSGMVPAVLLKKFYAKRVVLWIQDVWPDSVYAYGFKKTKVLAFFLDAFVRFVYRNCDAFGVSGRGFIKRVKPYVFGEQEIVYLPNWADELREEFEPFSFSEDAKVHFTFAGNVGKVQNLDNVIEAFGSLDDEYKDKAQLNIIGDGSHLEALKMLVKNREISNVVFWGRKPRNEMAKYFQATDFLIVSLVDKPIFSLTVPAKVQTYIAAKKPILAIINGDAADIVSDNHLGYVARPNDVSEITAIFQKAIETKEEEFRLFTQNCEALTKDTFNKDKIIDALLGLLIGK
ncbi:glycosyltransferase family 4 protein [Sulfurimonas indica]|uniref:glycosyltransferase family 4 protein n=1 Tax=Sulfurimonas indica TaxID=2508707 RepID=UPI001FE36CD7|nr:glycosyltransferase family 4 protein [Sulfurimonas indica]